MASEEFTGCKLALFLDDQLLVYKRDDYCHIPFPCMWDFPGGGREGQETAEQCVLRELEEEFSIVLPGNRLIYRKKELNHSHTGYSIFFVARAETAEIDSISFGDEGQYWQMMNIEEFLAHPEGIPILKSRLLRYLQTP